MRFMTRVLSIVLFLLLMVVSLGIMVAGIVPGTVSGWLSDWALALGDLGAASRLILVVVGALLVLSALSLIGWAIRAGSGDPAVRLPTVAGGEGTMSTSSISQRLQHKIGALSDVLAVTPIISTRGEMVSVDLDVETTPNVDVPAKTAEIVRVTRETLESGMGLKLDRVQVNTRQAPYARAGTAASPPQPL